MGNWEDKIKQKSRKKRFHVKNELNTANEQNQIDLYRWEFEWILIQIPLLIFFFIQRFHWNNKKKENPKREREKTPTFPIFEHALLSSVYTRIYKLHNNFTIFFTTVLTPYNSTFRHHFFISQFSFIFFLCISLLLSHFIIFI